MAMRVRESIGRTAPVCGQSITRPRNAPLLMRIAPAVSCGSGFGRRRGMKNYRFIALEIRKATTDYTDSHGVPTLLPVSSARTAFTHLCAEALRAAGAGAVDP
jgi:hypothetical protein